MTVKRSVPFCLINTNTALDDLIGFLRWRAQPAQGLPPRGGRGAVLHEEGRHGAQDHGGRKIQGRGDQGGPGNT